MALPDVMDELAPGAIGEVCARLDGLSIESCDVARGRRNDRTPSHRGGREANRSRCGSPPCRLAAFAASEALRASASGHRSGVAQLVTNDGPASGRRRIDAAGLEELGPEGARVVTINQKPRISVSLMMAGVERQLQRRRAHGLGDFGGAFYREFRHLGSGQAGRPDPYKHRTSILTPASTTMLV